MANRSRTAITRREFARRAAMASAATLLPPNALPASPGGLAAASQPPAQSTQLPPEAQAEAEARYENIIRAYGSRFSESQKADLRRMSLEAQPALDRVRAYHLENSDSPALYLKPLVEREKKASAAGSPEATGKPKP